MGRPNRIPKEMYNWICDQYLSGKSLSWLSRVITDKLDTNISRKSIENILIVNGITLRTKEERYALRSEMALNRPKKKYEGIDFKKLTNEIVSYYKNNKTFEEISTLLKSEFFIGIYPKEIKKILIQSGCPLRNKKQRYELARKKVNQTCLEKYGNICSLTNKDIKEKAEKTIKSKYGVTNVFAAKEIKDKIKQTSQTHYGVENPMQADCIKEKRRQTCQIKYGQDYFVQTKDFKEKVKQSYIQHYGVDHPMKSSVCKEKSKHTCLNKYAVEYSFQAESVKDQSKQTCLSKYGCENAMQNNDIKNKVIHTNIQRYGVPCVFGSQAIKEKCKKTMLDRYGVENILQNKDIRDRIKTANIEKYGVENVFAVASIREKIKQTMFDRYGCYHAPSWKFVCDKYSFDSFPELCFYLYWKSMDKSVLREGFGYKYKYQNKIHRYYPDFIVDGQAYEIKGNQFLKNDGTWQNPYDRDKNGEYEAKHQCALANNVKILYNNDYQKYIDWFYDTGHNIRDYKRRYE